MSKPLFFHFFIEISLSKPLHMSQFSDSSIRSGKSFLLILCLKLSRLDFLRSEGLLTFPLEGVQNKRSDENEGC